jgi:hypothetical protein
MSDIMLAPAAAAPIRRNRPELLMAPLTVILPYSSPKTVKWVSLRSLKEFVRVDCVLSATGG